MARKNLQVVFKHRPSGWVEERHFEIIKSEIPVPKEGEVLIKNIYMSVDPYMRGRMREGKSYATGFDLGKVMQAGIVGKVIESRNSKLPEGTLVNGILNWEQYSISNGRNLLKLNPGSEPLSYFLGVLGMPGMTAWIGLLKIGTPKPRETVFISAASGAVGQVAGQIAKIKGCRVVGSVGTNEKLNFIINDIGFDSGFNYKSGKVFDDSLKETCPEGIDIYFENVGGKMLDSVLSNLNPFSRIIACGMISQYNLEKPESVKNLMGIVGNRVLMQGFIVSDHFDELPQFQIEMSQWIKEGKIIYRESVTEGLENAPRAFIGMLKGENFGKAVVHIADE